MERSYVLAKFTGLYGSGSRRPSHIVLNSRSQYGGFKFPALCGVHVDRPWQGKLTEATCKECVRRWRRMVSAVEAAPPALPDPVHQGDVFSRIEATHRQGYSR